MDSYSSLNRSRRRGHLCLRGVTALLFLSVACRTPSTRPAGDAPSAAVLLVPAVASAPSVLTVVRGTSFESADLVALQLGRVEVVVRSTDRPTQNLPDAQISLRPYTDARGKTTDARGVAVFDSVPVGRYEVSARRVGYWPTAAPVVVKAGCRTDVEIYISLSALGIAPPPPTTARAVITTCS